MVLGNLNIHTQNYEIEPFSYIIYKNRLKQIKDLNIKPGTKNPRRKRRRKSS